MCHFCVRHKHLHHRFGAAVFGMFSQPSEPEESHVWSWCKKLAGAEGCIRREEGVVRM